MYKQIKKLIQMGLSRAQIIRIVSAYRFQRSICAAYYDFEKHGVIHGGEKCFYTHLESHIILLPFIGKRENILARKTKLMFDQVADPANDSVVTYEERFIGEYEGVR